MARAAYAPATVEIGMPVELTLRRFHEGGGLAHYFWKLRPMLTGGNATAA